MDNGGVVSGVGLMSMLDLIEFVDQLAMANSVGIPVPRRCNVCIMS